MQRRARPPHQRGVWGVIAMVCVAAVVFGTVWFGGGVGGARRALWGVRGRWDSSVRFIKPGGKKGGGGRPSKPKWPTAAHMRAGRRFDSIGGFGPQGKWSCQTHGAGREKIKIGGGMKQEGRGESKQTNKKQAGSPHRRTATAIPSKVSSRPGAHTRCCQRINAG